MAEKIKRTLQVPHTYTIIFVLMILVAVLTWIVPSGAFDTTEVGGREVTVSGTYQEIDKVIVDEETGEQTDLRQASMPCCRHPCRVLKPRSRLSRSSSSSAERFRSSRQPGPSTPA